MLSHYRPLLSSPSSVSFFVNLSTLFSFFSFQLHPLSTLLSQLSSASIIAKTFQQSAFCYSLSPSELIVKILKSSHSYNFSSPTLIIKKTCPSRPLSYATRATSTATPTQKILLKLRLSLHTRSEVD